MARKKLYITRPNSPEVLLYKLISTVISIGKKIVRYRTTVFAFYGWMTNLSEKRAQNYVELLPTVRWDNTLDVQATKFLTMQLTCQLFYDKVQIDKLQMKNYVSVGLSYKFKNK